MIKKILIVLVAILLLICIVGLLLPRHAHVSRSVSIDRPASLIYAVINSFQLFPKWSPWQDLDPNMHQSAEGPREGIGAKLVWSGNDKVGSGTQLITASTPDQAVASDLDFNNMGAAKSLMTLAPDGSMTRVTWTLDIDMGANPIGHYFGLLMDRSIGGDFAKGLGRLKTLLESMPNVDIAGLGVQEVQLTATPVLLVTQTATPDAIAKAYADGYGQIGKFMVKNKLRQAGAPLSIEDAASPTSYTFDAGIPVERNNASSADGVRVGDSYAGKALKATHVGAYQGMSITRDKLSAYLVAHGYAPKAKIIYWFVDDPGSVPAEKVRTEMYAPIE
jgi:Polyketide cyclase / dehydrase and lipid transport/GyrI-like small molecule binding domain